MGKERMIITGVVLAAGLLVCGQARAASRGGSSILVEVIDTGKKATRTMRFTIALAGDNRSSRMSRDEGATHYKIDVRRARLRDGAALVELELRRTEHHPRGRGQRRVTTITEVHLASRIALGRRVVMGQIERFDGGKLQIAVTLR
jgi:hypothetical protein